MLGWRLCIRNTGAAKESIYSLGKKNVGIGAGNISVPKIDSPTCTRSEYVRIPFVWKGLKTKTHGLLYALSALENYCWVSLFQWSDTIGFAGLTQPCKACYPVKVQVL
jgi:hypothetical protein